MDLLIVSGGGVETGVVPVAGLSDTDLRPSRQPKPRKRRLVLACSDIHSVDSNCRRLERWRDVRTFRTLHRFGGAC